MICSLCTNQNILFKNSLYYIKTQKDKYYPGYIQIVTCNHIKELSDLNYQDAQQIFDVIYQVEKLMRKIFKPDKINIASLGNMVPHLHWHIIPRFINDRHFPNPIWGDVTNCNYTPQLYIYQNQLYEFIDTIQVLFEIL